jgi:hypothetical protein
MRAAVLEQDAALQPAVATNGARGVREFRAATREFDGTVAQAHRQHEEAEEEALHERQEDLARRWRELADRDLALLQAPGGATAARRGEARRHELLSAFLAVGEEFAVLLGPIATGRSRSRRTCGRRSPRSRSRGSTATSPPASASRCCPRRRPTPGASCAWPIARSTRPRRTGATASRPSRSDRRARFMPRSQASSTLS